MNRTSDKPGSQHALSYEWKKMFQKGATSRPFQAT